MNQKDELLGIDEKNVILNTLKAYAFNLGQKQKRRI